MIVKLVKNNIGGLNIYVTVQKKCTDKSFTKKNL